MYMVRNEAQQNAQQFINESNISVLKSKEAIIFNNCWKMLVNRLDCLSQTVTNYKDLELVSCILNYLCKYTYTHIYFS